MLRSLLIRGLAHTLLQLLAYLVCLFLGWSIANALAREGMGINEMAVFYTLAFLGVILLIQNLATAVFQRKGFYFAAFAVALFLLCRKWGRQLDPADAAALSIFLVSALIALLLKFYLDRKIIRSWGNF